MSTVTLNQVKKALFHTPAGPARPSLTSDATKAFLLKYQTDNDVELAFKKFEKVRHKQRLKKLKKELETLGHDDWKYPPIETLIGLK